MSLTVTVVYRRLCEPTQRISLHFMYGGSVVGKKMFPGKMAICGSAGFDNMNTKMDFKVINVY